MMLVVRYVIPPRTLRLLWGKFKWSLVWIEQNILKGHERPKQNWATASSAKDNIHWTKPCRQLYTFQQLFTSGILNRIFFGGGGVARDPVCSMLIFSVIGAREAHGEKAESRGAVRSDVPGLGRWPQGPEAALACREPCWPPCLLSRAAPY